MSEVFNTILGLVEKKQVQISAHGYEELADDHILIREVLAGLKDAKVVEEYPDFPKGPCVLLLQKDGQHNPIHVVWGIPKIDSSLAVLVTAYRPDPTRWSDDFTRRRK